MFKQDTTDPAPKISDEVFDISYCFLRTEYMYPATRVTKTC